MIRVRGVARPRVPCAPLRDQLLDAGELALILLSLADRDRVVDVIVDGEAVVSVQFDPRVAVDEIGDDVVGLEPDRFDQRRVPRCRRLQIDMRARLDQQLDDLEMPALARFVKRRRARVAVDDIDKSARLEQEAHDVQRSRTRGEH